MAEIRAPFIVNFNITNKCNTYCKYCYAQNNRSGELETDKVINLINELFDKYGIFYMTIAGGEPLLHVGIIDIISTIFVKFHRRVQLLSNGIMLCDDIFYQKFRKVCFYLAEKDSPLDMQISLDSHTPQIHNINREHGELIIKAIERVLTLPVNLQLACVVTKSNVHIADKIIDHYYPKVLNFHYMNYIPPPPPLRNYIAIDPLPIAIALDFSERIGIKEQCFPGIKTSKIISNCESKPPGSMRAKGCLAGITRVDIGANLDVMPCCMSDEVIGNLHTEKFEDIWRSKKAEKVREYDYPLCQIYNKI